MEAKVEKLPLVGKGIYTRRGNQVFLRGRVLISKIGGLDSLPGLGQVFGQELI